MSAKDVSIALGQRSFLTGMLSSLLLLTLIFFLNFTSRVSFSPLMPVISAELGLDYLDSGSFFFCISLGYFVAILCSGFVSSRLNHQRTIALSSCLAGTTLLLVACCSSFSALRLCLVGLGGGAGLYFPSALATISRVVPSGYLARGMAIHELAPNCSFVLTPLLCAAILQVLSWRQGLIGLGVLMLAVGLAYGLKAENKSGFGIAPGLGLLSRMVRLQEFWLVTLMFSMGVCSTLGVYALLPLYLVAELGMEETAANTLVALSRISSIFMPMIGGWFGDRYGNGRIMGIMLCTAGLMTVPLGFTQGPVLIIFVVLQAMVAVCFFPSGFAVLSTIGEKRDHGSAVTFCLPLAFMIGGGVLPTLIGAIGDSWQLGYGFVAAGLLMITASTATIGLLRRM